MTKLYEDQRPINGNQVLLHDNGDGYRSYVSVNVVDSGAMIEFGSTLHQSKKDNLNVRTNSEYWVNDRATMDRLIGELIMASQRMK